MRKYLRCCLNSFGTLLSQPLCFVLYTYKLICQPPFSRGGKSVDLKTIHHTVTAKATTMVGRDNMSNTHSHDFTATVAFKIRCSMAKLHKNTNAAHSVINSKTIPLLFSLIITSSFFCCI